jgi:hypothetical protein
MLLQCVNVMVAWISDEEEVEIPLDEEEEDEEEDDYVFTGYNGPAGESIASSSSAETIGLFSGGAYQNYQAMRNDSHENMEHVAGDAEHLELNEKLQGAIAVRCF